MTAGFIFWLYFIFKAEIKDLFKIILGITVIIVIGVIIDTWFYQEFTLSFYNYFAANVIDGVASRFGVSPWYYYFLAIEKSTTFPFAFLLFTCMIIEVFYDKKNFIIWIIMPFLIAHIVTPHKELRFLFPLANLVPLLVLSTIKTTRVKFGLSNKIMSSAILLFFFIFNIFALIVVIATPADNGQINITRYIQDTYKKTETHLLIVGYDCDPYQPFDDLRMRFYKNDFVIRTQLTELPNPVNLNYRQNNLMVIRKRLVDKLSTKKLSLWEEINIGPPKWIFSIKKTFLNNSNDNFLMLFRLKPLKKNRK